VQFSSSSGDLAAKLASGQLSVVATAVNAVLGVQKLGAHVKVVYPRPSISFSAFGAIIKGTTHPRAAEFIARYLMTKPGQKLLNGFSCTYPPRRDTSVCPDLQPDLNTLKLVQITASDYIKDHDAIVQAASALAGVG
jgi:ABC-type Fe3+ transport system substrate-binding protein